MSFRVASVLSVLSFISPVNAALAGQLTSVPLSHAAGFQSVVCHIVNAGTKDMTVVAFDIRRAFGAFPAATPSGACTGSPPWTVSPGAGCSLAITLPSLCDQPNGCYCRVEFAGGPKSLRGNVVGTANGSTVALTAELK
jgi:hypothetical protein